MAKHDLIFFENRSTPKVVSQGASFDPPESYGKQTKRRAATEEEEQIIAKNGGTVWLRVDENGKKGGAPGYKKTKMPGREHLVKHEDDGVSDFLEHYGVKGMRWGVRRDERPLGKEDVGLNLHQRSQIKIASAVSALTAVGIASNAAAAAFQLQARFEHLQLIKTAIETAEKNPLLSDTAKEGLRATKNKMVKGLVTSAIATSAIAFTIGAVTQRTAKSYFAPIHKVYGDSKANINADLRALSRDIKKGKRPSMTSKEYNEEVAKIVEKHMTKNKNNLTSPFHELARNQLGLEYDTKKLDIKFEKLPNTDLYNKMTVTTPTGLRLVKAIKVVQHDDTMYGELIGDVDFYFDYKFDAEGYVVDFSCPTIEITNDLLNGTFDFDKFAATYEEVTHMAQPDSIDDFLEHYGVKGMKWGVRRALAKMPASEREGYLKEKESEWLKKVQNPQMALKTAQMTSKMARADVKVLTRDFKKNGKNDPVKRAVYETRMRTLIAAHANDAADRIYGPSKTGLYEVRVHRTAEGGFQAVAKVKDNAKVLDQLGKLAKKDMKRAKVEAKKVVLHADGDVVPDMLMFDLVVDADDLFIDILPVGSLEHNLSDTLEHFGVKGMKWGVRRNPLDIGVGTYDPNSQQSKDEAARFEKMKSEFKSFTKTSDMNKFLSKNARREDYIDIEDQRRVGADRIRTKVRLYKNTHLSHNAWSRLPDNQRYQDLSHTTERDTEKHWGGMSWDKIDKEEAAWHSETSKALEHFGVKGMKWGVRRSDAELARASAEIGVRGKEIVRESNSPRLSSGGVVARSNDKTGETELLVKGPDGTLRKAENSRDTLDYLQGTRQDPNKMSPDELRAAINQAEQVKKYNQLFYPQEASPLQQQVDRMRLEQQYVEAKRKYLEEQAKLNPPEPSKLTVMANRAQAGFSAYQAVDKAFGGLITAKISKELGIAPKPSKLDKLKEASETIKAESEIAKAGAAIAKARKDRLSSESEFKKLQDVLLSDANYYRGFDAPSKAAGYAGAGKRRASKSEPGKTSGRRKLQPGETL